MSKVIIGIHGRLNKPDKETLKNWWKQSMEEGLSKNQGDHVGLGHADFEMVYYADVYHNSPIPNNKNKQPYKEAQHGKLKRYEKGIIDRIRKQFGNWINNPLDQLEKRYSVFSSLAKNVFKIVLKDLGKYYNNAKKREQIKKRLKQIIIERQHDDIFLVSHSMGTLVAYDVLRELGKSEDYKEIKVEHFVTLGSPLGLTPVKGNILKFHE